MSTPTPAAVIGAIARSLTDIETVRLLVGPDYESSASIDRRTLASHIRAVAAEMRAEAKATRLNTVDPFMSIAVRNAEISEAQLLERFADRLEGRES